MGPFFFPDLLLDGCQVDSNSPFGSLLSNYFVSQSHTLLPAYLQAFMFLLELPVYFPGKKQPVSKHSRSRFPSRNTTSSTTHIFISPAGAMATDIRYAAGSLNKKSVHEISETNAEESNKVGIKMPDWLEGGKLRFFFPLVGDTRSSAPVVHRVTRGKQGEDQITPPPPYLPPSIKLNSNAFHLMWLRLGFEARSKQTRRRRETKEFRALLPK